MQRRSSSQDISWFLDLRRHQQLDMNPPYQRKSVWNSKDRRFFLDTVFRGYPSPPIFLHKKLDDDQQTIYAVVDGKQRLQTLFLFGDDAITLPEDFGDDRLNGKVWSSLTAEQREVFWNYVVPVEFLTFDTRDTKSVSQAFDRLNRNMRKLEAQELRHARWDGWFITLVEQECEKSFWGAIGVVTNARAKRMKDAQFVSELLLVLIDRRMFGFSQDHLDDSYGKYDDLDEPTCSLDADRVLAGLDEAKSYLAAMQSRNGCVKKYASTLAAFYSLWAIVVLHREHLGEPTAFADIYEDFMSLVKEVKSTDDPSSLIAGPRRADYKLADDYYNAGRGASTDFAQREKRLKAMLAFVEARDS